jgi:two-component system, sensor histidine kinase and response regulator
VLPYLFNQKIQIVLDFNSATLSQIVFKDLPNIAKFGQNQISSLMNHKYTILVVDDQRDNLMRIVEMIEDKFNDCEIFHALDGTTALNIAQREIPDLIILDWEMPGLNGIETTQKLKENPETKDIPVIICTGKMTSSKHLEIALSAGAVDYIRKPIDKVELLSRIRSMLLLSESYKNIKQLNENKDKLFSIIAHDLKNPIYTVKLLMEFLTKQELSIEKRNEILNGVRSSMSSAFNLLENLLAWANSQRNAIIFSPVLVKLIDAIDENINLHQLDAERKTITISCNVSSEITVFADKNMLLTIIRNIISNAIKYTSKGGKIEISAFEDGTNVFTTVKDNGMGIEHSKLEAILSDNSRSVKPTFDKNVGSGLGIQLCKEFLKLNKGKLGIKSTLNEGTEVIFSLPNQK